MEVVFMTSDAPNDLTQHDRESSTFNPDFVRSDSTPVPYKPQHPSIANEHKDEPRSKNGRNKKQKKKRKGKKSK
jgi:hypothetical protein